MRGFLFALLAGLIFQGLNTSVKLLVEDLPPLQVAWMRWITGILWIAPFALAQGLKGLRTQELHLHGLRSLFHAGGYGLWYSAVGAITLATTAALSFTGPLFVTMGAALFLGERVGRARWMAVLASQTRPASMRRSPSSPRPLRASRTRAMSVFSSCPMGSQPNLTAVKPRSRKRLARSPVSAGVAPNRELA